MIDDGTNTSGSGAELELISRPGRPTKYVPAMRERLLELIATGLPFVHACAAAGISFQSFCTYREQFQDFDQEIERAVALAIEKRLQNIRKAADAGDWRADSW